MVANSHKTCKMCGIEKPRDEFYKLTGKQYKAHWDCRDSYCKPCKSKSVNLKRQTIKLEAVAYLGGVCNDCGLESPHGCVYDFHHLDPTKKDFSFSSVPFKPLNKIKDELDKCVLLCANCHRIRHYV